LWEFVGYHLRGSSIRDKKVQDVCFSIAHLACSLGERYLQAHIILFSKNNPMPGFSLSFLFKRIREIILISAINTSIPNFKLLTVSFS
jgi:hypothetical protein